jgi:glycosyltransferase involved in cell wall biosynthesis
VSILIPTYNRANMPSRILQSILDQPFYDYEIIVVDDISADQTRAFVETCL